MGRTVDFSSPINCPVTAPGAASSASTQCGRLVAAANVTASISADTSNGALTVLSVASWVTKTEYEWPPVGEGPPGVTLKPVKLHVPTLVAETNGAAPLAVAIGEYVVATVLFSPTASTPGNSTATLMIEGDDWNPVAIPVFATVGAVSVIAKTVSVDLGGSAAFDISVTLEAGAATTANVILSAEAAVGDPNVTVTPLSAVTPTLNPGVENLVAFQVSAPANIPIGTYPWLVSVWTYGGTSSTSVTLNIDVAAVTSIPPYFFIRNKLNGCVIEIQNASTAAAALLDANSQSPSVADYQLWEFVPDPEGSRYYFIKSRMNGNVIDILYGKSPAGLRDGAPLDAYPQNASGQTDNQLWQFVEDPGGSGYCFIMSKMNGNVINLETDSASPGALMDSYPMKASGTDNQLWEVVDGSFPATVLLNMDASFGSNQNYIFSSDCDPIINALITIEITEDIVCKSVGPPAPTACNPPGPTDTIGFSFQLNCYSPPGFLCAWQQYTVGFFQNASGGFTVNYGIDNWPVSGDNLINNGLPTLATLPAAVLPAGYRITIGWGNDSTPSGFDPNVSRAIYTLTDNNGVQVGQASPTLTSLGGVTSSDLAPVVAFELNLVGPVNGETAVLSSGAGYISYTAPEASLIATAVEPLCTESGYITCETANSFYGLLPTNSNGSFKQSFQVDALKGAMIKVGRPRPSTGISKIDLQRILGTRE